MCRRGNLAKRVRIERRQERYAAEQFDMVGSHRTTSISAGSERMMHVAKIL